MKLRAEKKMRKHLLEQLKARRVDGARIAQGFKTARELQQLQMAPQVYMFKNLFLGQVLYSQVPAFHQDQINEQFPKPTWENRRPSRRQDLWRVMCVVNFANYDYAVAAYKGLVKLREARDIVYAKEAKAMRKKDSDGNTWFLGQYRPTHAQEAVADLAHVIDEFGLEKTRAFWELLWRCGDELHWNAELVEHSALPAYNPKYQSVLLDEMRERGLLDFAALEASV